MAELQENTPYDDVFKTQKVECPRLLIPVINEAFHKNYDENVEIRSTKGGLLISVDKKRNVSVYNIMGVCVFSQDVEGDCNITLPQGAYIVDGKKFFVR